jgi:hypothetical protein
MWQWHDKNSTVMVGGNSSGKMADHYGEATDHGIDRNHKWFCIVSKVVFQRTFTMKNQ